MDNSIKLSIGDIYTIKGKGNWLTQVKAANEAGRTFSDVIYLGASDSKSFWKEVTDEEKKAYLKSMQDQMAQNEADQINT